MTSALFHFAGLRRAGFMMLYLAAKSKTSPPILTFQAADSYPMGAGSMSKEPIGKINAHMRHAPSANTKENKIALRRVFCVLYFFAILVLLSGSP